MANDKLSEQSMDFAVQIINLVKQLKEQRESIISNQIGKRHVGRREYSWS